MAYKYCRKFQPAERAHERYSQDDRLTDDRRTGDSIANVNVSWRSVKKQSLSYNVGF